MIFKEKKLYYIFLLFLLMWNYCASETTDDILISDKIYVDETAKDSLSAKNIAVQKALQKAIKTALKTNPKQTSTENIHYSYSILKENFTDTRYQAILQFKFNKSNLMESMGLSQPAVNTELKPAPVKTLDNGENLILPKVYPQFVQVDIPIPNISLWINKYKYEVERLFGLSYKIKYMRYNFISISVEHSEKAFCQIVRNLKATRRFKKSGPSRFVMRF